MRNLTLKQIDYLEISNWFVDFQKHSKSYQLPSDGSETFGIYLDNKLIGYFVIKGFEDKSVWIEQGYLQKQYRHMNLSKYCLGVLEHMCKQAGYQRIELCTQNRFKSYIKFMGFMGYKPKELIFSKDI